VPSTRTEIVYRSENQRALLATLAKVAPTDAEILITGPSGVGKELYAAYAHEHSRRSARPLVTINCSNLSSHLLENEVFGHARGAYTGAHAAMGGIAAAAEGGSLFLDEVDTLPAASQAKLLRFIQTKEYRRLGETSLRRADVRLIAASNVDLEQQVRDGQFRKDLFFRLRVVPVEVKALVDRPEDIEPLLDHFITRYAGQYEVAAVRFSAAARRCLIDYGWPGNVRELENCVRYLTCLQLGRAVETRDLPLCCEEPEPPPAASRPAPAPERYLNGTLREAKSQLIGNFERYYVDRALQGARGNVSDAARASGKHRRAFFELMRKYGFDAADYRGLNGSPRPLPPEDK
jgi:two-component system, NtrC family, response regulator GlrR